MANLHEELQFLQLNHDNIYNISTYLDGSNIRNLAATCKFLHELLYTNIRLVKKAKLEPLTKSFCFHKFIPIAHLTDAFTLTSYLADTKTSAQSLFRFIQNRIKDLITLEDIFIQHLTTKPPPVMMKTLIHETCDDLIQLISKQVPHVNPRLKDILLELKERLFQRTRFYYLDGTSKQAIYIMKLNMYFHTYLRNMITEITYANKK